MWAVTPTAGPLHGPPGLSRFCPLDVEPSRPEQGVCFADEDIKLNSTLFLWPDQIEDVFENSRNLLLSKRDQAELDLVKRYRERV